MIPIRIVFLMIVMYSMHHLSYMIDSRDELTAAPSAQQ
jgi:hypothetical protein